jgi:hypothetical protein
MRVRIHQNHVVPDETEFHFFRQLGEAFQHLRRDVETGTLSDMVVDERRDTGILSMWTPSKAARQAAEHRQQRLKTA